MLFLRSYEKVQLDKKTVPNSEVMEYSFRHAQHSQRKRPKRDLLVSL